MKGRRTFRKLAPAALLALAVVSLAAQTAQVQLRIVSPAEGSYAAGTSRLLAEFVPAAAAADAERVTFFADGQQICAPAKPPFECEWDAGEHVRAHQIRAVATMRDGRRLVHNVTTRALDYVETVDVDLVQITAVVTDDHNQFVTGLTQNDFVVTEDGKRQKLTNFSAGTTPLELVTAIDVSSSVTPALPGMKKAAARFLAGLEDRDRVTVLGFNDNIFTLARRTTDAAVRDKAIGRLAAWGGTALYDAMVKALDVLAGQSGRRSLVLFTDGDDQNSHVTMEDALAQVEASDAVIYAIGAGRAGRDKDLQKLLQKITKTSGGRAFFNEGATGLDDTFAAILDDLHHQYTLAYPAPHDRRDGAWHKLTVQAGGGKYHVRARQGYRLAPRP
jgi:VWFA-related protein